MNQEVITPWIEHLTNPFTLAGFALFMLAFMGWIFKPSQTEALSGASIERIVTKLIYTCLILGVLAIGLGFAKDLLRPTKQVISHVENSTIAQGRNKAGAAQEGQVRVERCTDQNTPRTDQEINNIKGSVIAQSNCDAAANSNTELKTGQ